MNMNRLKRITLAQNHDISSLADLKAFAREVLLESGFDIDIVNLKEDGVSIESFKKLCTALYDLGYKEGMEGKSIIRGKEKELEYQGRILTKHQRSARFFSDKNQINK